tara:strand:+ start:77 stop:217 length:141 start_codon:yes stop_codon:yes gene_type:complete
MTSKKTKEWTPVTNFTLKKLKLTNLQRAKWDAQWLTAEMKPKGIRT